MPDGQSLRHVGLLPNAHAAVDQQRLAVNVLSRIGQQKHRRRSTDFGSRNFTVGRVQLHPRVEFRILIQDVRQRRAYQSGAIELTRMP